MLDVGVLLDEALRVLLPPEHDSGPAEVAQRAAHHHAALALVPRRQPEVRLAVRPPPGGHVRHVVVVEDVVRPDGRGAGAERGYNNNTGV